MNGRTRVVRGTATAAVVVAVLAVAADAAWATGGGRTRWRSSRYGRKGAEIWLEAPRLGVPVGTGYEGDHDARDGWGFGFGLMFAFSDNFGLEGRLVQTNHAGESNREWDLDQAMVGLRYFFRYEEQVQPFIGVGGAHVSFEWTPRAGLTSDFERLTGYGVYATAGADYVLSNRWVFGLRADYTWVNYTKRLLGISEESVDPLNGSSLALSLSVSYRAPIWW